LVRLALWPLMRRQLHQTKLMRALQPELKKIKVKANGNRTLESQLMMELYKERGVKIFSSIWVLLIQIPILFALFTVLRTITQQREQIRQYTYGFWNNVAPIKDILANPQHFNERLFGVLDLTQVATHSWPIAVLAVLTAGFQLIQSRQILPKVETKRRLRDVLKDQADGAVVDQSEMSALLSRRLTTVMPVIVLFFMVALPGALVLYYAVQSLVAILQQRYFFNRDADEMIQSVETPPVNPGKKATAKARAKAAREAEVVSSKEKS
jgi:YidC/Oxa1 family membrane protein insertase